MDQPFSETDLPPLRDGFHVRPPDFVGVGTPKAGTSWWYSLMLQHPSIFPHRLFDPGRPQDTKELHFFEHFAWGLPSDRDRHAYLSAFASPAGGICGEWSVYYMNQPLALEHVHAVAPETRILVLLRDPVARTLSHLNHVSRNRAGTLGLDGVWLRFFQTYSVSPEAFLHSTYAMQLQKAEQLFGAAKVLVLQYEKCVRNPEEELARTFAFLGVDDAFRPPMIRREVNRQEYVIDRPAAELRRMIAEYFQHDVEQLLTRRPEIDLALWPELSELLSG